MINLNARGLVLAMGLAVAGMAAAQSPTANLSGEGKPGDIAVIHNVDTGFTREVKVKRSGRYQLRNLQIGTFTVTLKHADGTFDTPKLVTLRVGSTTRVR